MSDGAQGRSAQISALVAQLKAGQITKGELFDKLQRLQRGETVRGRASAAARKARRPNANAADAAPPPAPALRSPLAPAPSLAPARALY